MTAISTCSNDRICCVVPYCRRTAKRRDPNDEWICAVHYKLVDKDLKTLRRKIRNRYSKWPTETRLNALYRLWDLMKFQAIERAMGL